MQWPSGKSCTTRYKKTKARGMHPPAHNATKGVGKPLKPPHWPNPSACPLPSPHIRDSLSSPSGSKRPRQPLACRFCSPLRHQEPRIKPFECIHFYGLRRARTPDGITWSLAPVALEQAGHMTVSIGWGVRTTGRGGPWRGEGPLWEKLGP